MNDAHPIRTAGLNLHVYPSTLTNASRVFKIARTLQADLGFDETHAVGIRAGDLPASEEIAPRAFVRRLTGSDRGGFIGRILKVVLWQPRVYREYRDANIAIVAAHNVWVLPLCHRIARRAKAVLAYNPHELETETVAMRGVKRQLARWIERKYVRRADVHSTVNGSIAAWYEKTYRIPRPVAVTNIPVDAPAGPVDLRARLGIPDESLLFVHTGHLTSGRNIPAILDAFAELPERHVVFIGDGPLEVQVRAAASKHSNIHQLPPVAADSVVAHLRGADVGLCLIEGTSLSLKLSTPNKLFESLAASTPVLATGLPEVRAALGASAEEWTIDDISQLPAKVAAVTNHSVVAFRHAWPGLGTWEEQVEPLIDEYRRRLHSLRTTDTPASR